MCCPGTQKIVTASLVSERHKRTVGSYLYIKKPCYRSTMRINCRRQYTTEVFFKAQILNTEITLNKIMKFFYRYLNLFSGHENCFITTAVIPRLDFKLLFRAYSSKFGKGLYCKKLDVID